MKEKNSKIKHIVGAFLATALIISGCGDETEETAQQPVPETPQTQPKLAGQRLTDDNGVEYTLIDNGDGTETARYDDGRAVTFRRQEDGSLDFVSGAAGLIAGMAAGYFLFHGFSSPAGTWDSARNRYTVSEPLRRDDRNLNGGAGTSTRPSSSTSSASTSNPPAASNSSTRPASSSSSSGGVNLSKPAASNPSSSASSAKTGFGGAGARASSSAAS